MGWWVLLVVAAVAWYFYARIRSERGGREEAQEAGRSSRAASAGKGEHSGGDPWEGSFWEVADARRCHVALRIAYVDGSGQRSRRDVIVRQFDGAAPGGLVLAHCQLRDATRSFRMDRMEDVVDVGTGEIVPNVHSHLLREHASSPEGQLDKVLREHGDVMRVLLYIAKADGAFRAAEKVVVARLATELAGGDPLDPNAVGQALLELGPPTLAAYRLAVGRIAALPLRARVLDAARQLVATQKTVAAAEQEALDYMARRFDAPMTAA